jgi:hypothetical protein
MSTQGVAATGAAGRDRTLAQWYALVVGLVLVAAGIFGFIADSSFDTGANVSGDKLLGLEVNGWHNIVHLLTGGLLLSGWRRRDTAKMVCLVFGVAYAAVALYGLVDGNDIIHLLPINGADNGLHIALAALALVFGATSAGDEVAHT